MATYRQDAAIKSWRSAMFGLVEASAMAAASLENLASALRNGGTWSASGVRMGDDPSGEKEALRIDSVRRGPSMDAGYVDEIQEGIEI